VGESIALFVLGGGNPINAPGANFSSEEGSQGYGRGVERGSVEAKGWPDGVGDFES
jgi:hypothetical protein